MAGFVTRESNQLAQAQPDAAAAPAHANAQVFLSELQSLTHRLTQILRTEDGPKGVAPATRDVLETLRREGPRTVPQLARLRGTSRQNIQIMVNRLERDGWVRSLPNLAHKRSDLIAVTPSAESFLEASSDPQSKIAGLVAQELSASDLTAGLQLFEQLKRLFQQIQGAGEISADLPAGGRTSAKQKTPRETSGGSAWQTEENELPVNLL